MLASFMCLPLADLDVANRCHRLSARPPAVRIIHGAPVHPVSTWQSGAVAHLQVGEGLTVAAPVGAKCSGAAPHNIGYLHLFTHDYFGFNVQMKDSQVHWESHTSDHPLKSTNGQYWSEAVRNKESQFFLSPQVTQLTPLHTFIQCHTCHFRAKTIVTSMSCHISDDVGQ